MSGEIAGRTAAEALSSIFAEAERGDPHRRRGVAEAFAQLGIPSGLELDAATSLNRLRVRGMEMRDGLRMTDELKAARGSQLKAWTAMLQAHSELQGVAADVREDLDWRHRDGEMGTTYHKIAVDPMIGWVTVFDDEPIESGNLRL